MRQTKILLFVLCAVWTCIQMALVLLEFLGLQSVHLPAHMPFAYYILLGVYALVKESARWAQKKLPRMRGEWFFIAWWVYALVLFTVSAASGERYVVPKTLSALCEFVSVIYVASSASKLLHGVKCIEVRFNRSRRYKKGVQRETANRR